MPHSTPEPNDHLAIQLPRRTRELVHLLRTPDLQTTYCVEPRHTSFSHRRLPWIFLASSLAMAVVFSWAKAGSREARWALNPRLKRMGLRASRPAIRHRSRPRGCETPRRERAVARPPAGPGRSRGGPRRDQRGGLY